MNLPDHELENVLRKAPAPVPPPSLEADLLRSVPASLPKDARNGREMDAVRTRPSGGVRRWWPMLIPSLAAAAFAAGLVVQQVELSQLREEIRNLEAEVVPLAGDPATGAEAGVIPGTAVQPDAGARQDLERLRALVEALRAEVAVLEAGRALNDGLRAEIRALETQLPQDLQTSMAMQARAAEIRCVNNLKQLGLAVRVWATDNEDEFPPDILSMTNELSTPKVLVCPADEGRTTAEGWDSYTAANCSYEFVSPGPGKFENEPNRLMFRCPVHGSITLCDGSVQRGVAKEHPERLQVVNGVWYLMPDETRPAVVPGGTPTGAAADPGAGGSIPPRVLAEVRRGTPVLMDPVLAQRYGLAVATNSAAPGGAEVEVHVEAEAEAGAEGGEAPGTEEPRHE